VPRSHCAQLTRERLNTAGLELARKTDELAATKLRMRIDIDVALTKKTIPSPLTPSTTASELSDESAGNQRCATPAAPF
jgi:hypothetical protein